MPDSIQHKAPTGHPGKILETHAQPNRRKVIRVALWSIGSPTLMAACGGGDAAEFIYFQF
jgi:hypothetical protein